MSFAESTVEAALIEWLKRDLRWTYIPGPELAPDGAHPERATYEDTVLEGRLRAALKELNSHLPDPAIEDAFRKVVRPPGTTLLARNRAFHRMLTDGVEVEYRDRDGRVRGDRANLFDFAEPKRNDWLAVNQLTIALTAGPVENRRADVVLYVNGLPLVLLELKNPGDENATMKDAYNQLLTYQAQVPDLFAHNELLIISDGVEAGLGALTSNLERFTPWRTIDGAVEAEGSDQLETLARGVFDKRRLLDIISGFVLFEDGRAGTVKKVAAYHQYWAVRKAVEETARAQAPGGDRRAGVVWHTQGSGKSLSMVFFAARVIRDPRFRNPTLVVLTDRNDLDGQLHSAFAGAPDLVPSPVQAEDREELRTLLQVASGGVVFSTVQKFLKPGETHPLLNDRSNIVVIADEAHRSQYDFVQGFARNIRLALPNASFIGFTGTPIVTGDRVTRSVFGDYIDVYDIAQAVADGATVPIYYEGRLAEIDLDPEFRPQIDVEFDEVTETEEEGSKARLRSRWARIERVVGTDKRLKVIAEDIVEHFEARLAAMDGKGMVVCMSRRIAAALYAEIIALRPDWHTDDDATGTIKVVITGAASDSPELRAHVRNKRRNEAIQDRLRDPADPLRLVIVRDMWLTGFDCPPLHTLYVDKPMQGHTLMQAIARVNRVFRDKPGGLVVDYIGLGEWLKRALRDYTASRGRGEPAIDIRAAVAALREKLDVCRGILRGFEYSGFASAHASQRLKALTGALDRIEGVENGRGRFLAASADMLRAFRLAGAEREALELRDEVAFLLAIRGRLAKLSARQEISADELDFRIGQIVSRAVVAGGVRDILAEAGIEHPNVSLIDDRFLDDLEKMPERNLAAAALERLLRDDIKVRLRRNVVESSRFSDRLDEVMVRYHNRSIEAAQVVLELVELAKELRERSERGEKLGLNADELAFYDALADNSSAVQLMGDATLRAMAHELAETLRASVTVDWQLKESVRASLRSQVRRLLRRHRYPPDRAEHATDLVLVQAEVLSDEWAASGARPKLRIVTEAEAAPYVRHLPLTSLAAAAGAFRENRPVEVDGWVEVLGRKLREGMFVASVEGRSMEPRIPSGSYCIFRAEAGGGPLAGSRQGKIVLAELLDARDPENAASFTVKVYRRDRPLPDDSGERESPIRLEPLNPAFPAIVLSADHEVSVVAELIEVLGPA